MTNTASAAVAASNVVFFELLPEFFGDETLPACPDGSGDLWWDDASYARYQAWDGPTYRPVTLVREADTAGYCDGVPAAWLWSIDDRPACACHRAEWERRQAVELPF